MPTPFLDIKAAESYRPPMTTSTYQQGNLVIGLSILLSDGCRSKVDLPDLDGLYSEVAQLVGPGRNPVIVIPGILGLRLVDLQSGRVAWAAFAGDYVNPETDDGACLASLPMQQSRALRQLSDGMVPDGAMGRLKVRLLLLSIELVLAVSAMNFWARPTCPAMVTLHASAPSWTDQPLTKSTSGSFPRYTGATCCFCSPITSD